MPEFIQENQLNYKFDGNVRLYTFIEWVKETLASVDQLRNSEFTFNDKVFDHEMNLKIKESSQNFDRLLFKGMYRRHSLIMGDLPFIVYRGFEDGIL